MPLNFLLEAKSLSLPRKISNAFSGIDMNHTKDNEEAPSTPPTPRPPAPAGPVLLEGVVLQGQGWLHGHENCAVTGGLVLRRALSLG